MRPDQLIFLIPIIFLSIPIVAILTEHQRKMLELKLRLKGEVPSELKAELTELKTQIAQLRDTTTKFDMSFDAAISRLEDRVGRVEGRQHETSSAAPPAYQAAPAAEEPAIVTVGQGGGR